MGAYKATGRPVGRPNLGDQAIRENISVRVKPGAKAMLQTVGAHTGEPPSMLVRRYIQEGLARDIPKYT